MKKQLFLLIAMPFVAFFSSCSSDEDLAEAGTTLVEEQEVWLRPARFLTASNPEQEVEPVAPAAAPAVHRIVMQDQATEATNWKGDVATSWVTSDRVGVWNITAASKGQRGYNYVNPKENGSYVRFQGEVNCDVDDSLSLFYPSSTTNVSASLTGKITFDLGRQKGTLEDIAANHHIMYGKAIVTSIRENGEAAANIGYLKPAVTLFEFRFKDESQSPIWFNRLRIKVDGIGTKGTLDIAAQTFTVSEKDSFCIYTDTAVKKVYVAIPGDVAGKRFWFDIVDKYGFAHKASAKTPASLKNGQIARVELSSKEGEYIEFDDVKWAKGNLIWDGGTMQGVSNHYANTIYRSYDNYFIAPSQEWSPEQLSSTLLSNMPCWPIAPPVHGTKSDTIFTVWNPSVYDAYYSTYYLGTAGKNGETSARGRVITSGSTTPTGGASLTVIQKTFPTGGIDYQKKLWNDEYLSDTVALKKALNDGKSASYYFGDLPYLVSRGRYCMPKIEQLKSLFSHKNACWGVVFVKDNGQTANINMRVGTKHKEDDRLLPIYGLYIDKTRSYSQILSEGRKLYTGSEWGNEKAWINTNKKPAFKGCAVVLQAADLKRGIFLPADGIRTAQFASGGLEYVSGCQPGEYCSYIGSTFGEGAVGKKNARHYTARADNHGTYGNGGDDNVPDVVQAPKDELRTNTGSIRPIFIGNVFK